MIDNRFSQIVFSLRFRVAALAAVIAVTGLILPLAVSAQNRELSLADILIALRSKKAVMEEKNRILADAIKTRGITFQLTADIEKELGSTGAQRELIDAIKSRMPAPAVVKVEPKPEVIASKPAPPPPDFAFYMNASKEAADKNDLDVALAQVTKAIELKPASAEGYYSRGRLLVRQDKHEAAIADFQRALQHDPKNVAALLASAQSKEKLGNTEAAMADYRRTLDLDSVNESANSAFNRLMAEKAAAEAKAKVAAAASSKAPETPLSASNRIAAVGPLNNYAVRVVQPAYSPNDRKLGFRGKVTVTVELDEKGEILAATATDGPKPLRSASEAAVKATKFRPVQIDGQPVRATGYMTYNFIP